MFRQMNGHLADTLLYLSSGRFEGEDVISLLSRKEIAEFAGISTESAVKLLKTFEKEGIIRLEEKKVSILNRDLLREISKRG
jgi:CRP/FNR family transcriptional regulator